MEIPAFQSINYSIQNSIGNTFPVFSVVTPAMENKQPQIAFCLILNNVQVIKLVVWLYCNLI